MIPASYESPRLPNTVQKLSRAMPPLPTPVRFPLKVQLTAVRTPSLETPEYVFAVSVQPASETVPDEVFSSPSSPFVPKIQSVNVTVPEFG
jgi:hypothetical protein